MKRIFNMLRGYISIKVQCMYPERFLNICALNGVEIWNIKREENTIYADVRIKDYRRLRKILDKEFFDMGVSRRSGAPFFLIKFKKRYVLVGAMGLSLLLLWFSSLFIWEIRVSGNNAVSTSEILYVLDEMGIKTGSFRLGISQEEISNTVLLKIPELSYITVNTNGSIANVIVREKDPVPEMEDRDYPTSIVATKDGIINKMTVLEGKAVVSEGDTVLKGDLIVSGEMESIAGTYRYVHAKAEVYARTWYDVSVEAPGETFEKSYTGDTTTRYTIIFAGKHLDLYINSGIPYTNYDKITSEEKLSLFDKLSFPVTVIKETYREYELVPVGKSQEESVAELENFALRLLQDSMKGGTVIHYSTETDSSSGNMVLTVSAECTEQIGIEQDISSDQIKSNDKDEGEP